MKEFLFSYGTLRNEKVQIEVFGRPLIGTKDVLEGHKVELIEIKDELFLSRNEHKHQQTIIPSKDKTDRIEGMVFEVSEDELRLTDKYEPNNYKRIKVKLQSGKEAWIYGAV